MFRYRLHSPDGDDLGEATYAQMIKPGEEIIAEQRALSASSPSSLSMRRTSRRSSGCYRSRVSKASLRRSSFAAQSGRPPPYVA
jgi:hypothetical protein